MSEKNTTKKLCFGSRRLTESSSSRQARSSGWPAMLPEQSTTYTNRVPPALRLKNSPSPPEVDGRPPLFSPNGRTSATAGDGGGCSSSGGPVPSPALGASIARGAGDVGLELGATAE